VEASPSSAPTAGSGQPFGSWPSPCAPFKSARCDADEQPMSRLRNPGLVLLQRPIPVTIGRGGLAPVFALGALFAGISARGGLPVATAAVIGEIGGTGSLIVHELGHVRAARKLTSLQPTGVSLIWLGAATRLEGAYASGRDQAKVAIAGPRASFGVALLLVPVLFLPIPIGLKDIVITLAALNVAIGVVSLIPASPLDGYKLIVGLLWVALGSEAVARRLIRRLALTWVAVEIVGAGILLVEKPLLGMMVIAIGASLFGQKLFVRHFA
jgi:Zn-dependent protease